MHGDLQQQPAGAAPATRAYPRDQVTAGVLAGGQGRRMGGADKGLVELAGRPMAAWVAAALRPQAAEVLISANRNLPRYAGLGARVVPDRTAGFSGPLMGIASLMAAARTPWLLVAPCDSPHVPADLGGRLWRALVATGAELAVADSGAGLEPVHALLPCALQGDLAAWLASGRGAVRAWQARHRVAVADCSDVAERFFNVNTEVERRALAARWQGGRHG